MTLFSGCGTLYPRAEANSKKNKTHCIFQKLYKTLKGRSFLKKPVYTFIMASLKPVFMIGSQNPMAMTSVTAGVSSDVNVNQLTAW